MLNVDLRKFKKNHKKKLNQIIYYSSYTNGLIEITKIQLVAIGKVPKISKPKLKTNNIEPMPYQKRKIWIDSKIKWFDTPVYDGSTLYTNNKVVGPAIVNENTSTIFLGGGDELVVDKIGNYLIKTKRNTKKLI